MTLLACILYMATAINLSTPKKFMKSRLSHHWVSSCLPMPSNCSTLLAGEDHGRNLLINCTKFSVTCNKLQALPSLHGYMVRDMDVSLYRSETAEHSPMTVSLSPTHSSSLLGNTRPRVCDESLLPSTLHFER